MPASRLNSAPFSTGTLADGDESPGLSRAAWASLVLIRLYKIALSPLFAGSCRFMPGCADYMSESITRFGFVRGGWLGTKRLCRCRPFGGHGFDPVPDRIRSRRPPRIEGSENQEIVRLRDQ